MSDTPSSGKCFLWAMPVTFGCSKPRDLSHSFICLHGPKVSQQVLRTGDQTYLVLSLEPLPRAQKQ